MLSEPTESAALLYDGKRIENAWDASLFFDVPYSRMTYVLYRAPDHQRYTPFEIPKRSGGMRQIHAPVGLIRDMQERLAPVLQEIYSAHPNAHGFIRGRSILSNARLHAGQRLVLNVDLADFFPSINFGRVRGLFMRPPFALGPAAAAVFAQLCTWRNGLPQGAPTSPVLSNLIATDLDRRLTRLARETNTRYSRYADDITFSCNQAVMPPALVALSAPLSAQGEGASGAPGPLSATVGEGLERAINASGFTVNVAKVRLQRRHQRQSVTGLNVNEKPNVSRLRVRQLRAMLHAWERFGLEAAANEHFLKYRGLRRPPNNPGRAYRNVVYGQLSFLKMVRGPEDPVFLNAAAKVLKLDPNPSRFLRQMVFGADDFDVFISHAGEDKEEIARPIRDACERLGLKVGLDEAHIGWGQSFTTKINSALGAARTVLAIISSTSVAKEWPVVEVNTALSLEVAGQKKVVPLIVGKPDLSRLPLISGKDSMFWDRDANAVARRLLAAAKGDAPRRPSGAAGDAAPAGASVPPVHRERPQPGSDGGAVTTPPAPEPTERRGLLGRLFGGKKSR